MLTITMKTKTPMAIDSTNCCNLSDFTPVAVARDKEELILLNFMPYSLPCGMTPRFFKGLIRYIPTLWDTRHPKSRHPAQSTMIKSAFAHKKSTGVINHYSTSSSKCSLSAYDMHRN